MTSNSSAASSSNSSGSSDSILGLLGLGNDKENIENHYENFNSSTFGISNTFNNHFATDNLLFTPNVPSLSTSTSTSSSSSLLVNQNHYEINQNKDSSISFHQYLHPHQQQQSLQQMQQHHIDEYTYHSSHSQSYQSHGNRIDSSNPNNIEDTLSNKFFKSNNPSTVTNAFDLNRQDDDDDEDVNDIINRGVFSADIESPSQGNLIDDMVDALNQNYSSFQLSSNSSNSNSNSSNKQDQSSSTTSSSSVSEATDIFAVPSSTISNGPVLQLPKPAFKTRLEAREEILQIISTSSPGSTLKKSRFVELDINDAEQLGSLQTSTQQSSSTSYQDSSNYPRNMHHLQDAYSLSPRSLMRRRYSLSDVPVDSSLKLNLDNRSVRTSGLSTFDDQLLEEGGIISPRSTPSDMQPSPGFDTSSAPHFAYPSHSIPEQNVARSSSLSQPKSENDQFAYTLPRRSVSSIEGPVSSVNDNTASLLAPSGVQMHYPDTMGSQGMHMQHHQQQAYMQMPNSFLPQSGYHYSANFVPNQQPNEYELMQQIEFLNQQLLYERTIREQEQYLGPQQSPSATQYPSYWNGPSFAQQIPVPYATGMGYGHDNGHSSVSLSSSPSSLHQPLSANDNSSHHIKSSISPPGFHSENSNRSIRSSSHQPQQSPTQATIHVSRQSSNASSTASSSTLGAAMMSSSPNDTISSSFAPAHDAPIISSKGNIIPLSKDQHGCRYLQQRVEIEGNDACKLIIEEAESRLCALMIDAFGNYLFQKLIEHATEEQRSHMLETVQGSLLQASLNIHGTRSAQKFIEVCGSNEKHATTIMNELITHIVTLSTDTNGNHVVQRCLQHLSTKHKHAIYEISMKNIKTIACHRHGCCVYQRCIDSASGTFLPDDQQQNGNHVGVEDTPYKLKLIGQITDNAVELMQDPFANYVVQHVLQQTDEASRNKIIKSTCGHLVMLSMQKFSSNVVEKCLLMAPHDILVQLIDELTESSNVVKLLRDSFANYVVQSAFSVGDDKLAIKVVDSVRPHMEHLSAVNLTCAKRIAQKAVQRFPLALQDDPIFQNILSQNTSHFQHPVRKNGPHSNQQHQQTPSRNQNRPAGKGRQGGDSSSWKQGSSSAMAVPRGRQNR